MKEELRKENLMKRVTYYARRKEIQEKEVRYFIRWMVSCIRK